MGRFDGKDILLKLPEGTTVQDVHWFSIWCRRFRINFGSVMMPPGLKPPKPAILPEFSRLAHGLQSGNITILDTKTFYIPDLYYDGLGPDAFFWVGKGEPPVDRKISQGMKVPNELGE